MAEKSARLILVTPSRLESSQFRAVLDSSIRAGDVAAVILDLASDQDEVWHRTAEELCPVVQGAGAAFLIRDRAAVARAVGADGVHCTGTAATLAAEIRALKPKLVVGSGDCTTRHAAMTRGEPGPDYIFLGRLDSEEDQPAAATLVEWWVELFELPCVAMSAGDWITVPAAIAAGADFIALRDLVWRHREGPMAAVKRAQATIDEQHKAMA